MINPILERELRTKMRSWKSPISVLIFLMAIGMMSYIGSASILGNVDSWGIEPRAATGLFDFITVFQLIFIMFIMPILTATSISGERERQTLDLMLCADISPWQIILGKMTASMSFILLMTIMAMPFMALIFVMGGISITHILTIELYYLLSAFVVATVGIYASATFKKNLTAIIGSYAILGILYVLPFFFFAIIGIAGASGSSWIERLFEDNAYILISLLFGANPGFGLLSLLTNGNEGIKHIPNDALPWLSELPTWSISIVFFVIISVVMLFGAKKNLMKRRR